MDVFPVEILLQGEAIWLGWVSPEDSDEFFLTHKGCLIFSCDGKSGLVREVVKIFPDAKIKSQTFFNFDSVAEGLDKRGVVEDDFALNLWNLLTDLYHTFGGEDRIFSESHGEIYYRLFSQSDVASLVDVEKHELSLRDVDVIRGVILDGAHMLTQKIEIAKAYRNR